MFDKLLFSYWSIKARQPNKILIYKFPFLLKSLTCAFLIQLLFYLSYSIDFTFLRIPNIQFLYIKYLSYLSHKVLPIKNVK